MARDDIFDEEEIDSLLGSLDEDDTDETAEASPVVSEETEADDKIETTDERFRERTIKQYNFKRPDKFSKDQMRTLQMIHESFARTTTSDLSAQLRSLASLNVASVEQLSYEEFMDILPNPTTLGIIDMDPLDGNAIFEMDPELVFEIVDRLFGGGEGIMPFDVNRELTDIEHSVIERIFMSILNNLHESWEDVIDLHPRLEQVEANPQFVQIIPPNDMVVLITFNTKIGDVEGKTHFCIPYVILGPVMNKLSATFWYGSSAHELSDDQMQKLRKKIDYVRVPVSVEIGRTKIDIEEFLKLEVGDVVKLDTGMESPFTLKVNGKPKFNCQPGYRGRAVAVQILEPREEEEFIANLMDDLKDRMMTDQTDFQSEAMTSGRRRSHNVR